jgi:leucyl aminopeptidase
MIITSAPVEISVANRPPSNASAVVFFISQGDTSVPSSVGKEIAAAANRLLSSGVAKGKPREITFDLVGEGKSAHRVFLAGLGEKAKITAESVRQASGAVLRALRKHNIANAAIIPPELKNISPASAADAVATGISLAAFDYREYKGAATKEREKADEKVTKPLTVTLIGDSKTKAAVDRAKIITTGQNFCRTIASRPGNDINPPSLARESQAMAREAGLRCKVLDDKELTRLKMGGILAVGAGSIQTPPRMIILEHKPARAKKTLLVVGKAITFDTGGISIKPADKMGKMIFDKCGAMAVLGLMYSAAKLKLPIHIVGILASAENAISSKAYRPGDILRMYNGVTVEVTNTDAEGRLVLADALAYGIEQFKPAAIVDLATLTGGVIVALGKTMAGVMSNDDALVKTLTDLGQEEGEKLWRLPLGPDQRDFIKSEFADIVNSAGREGHPLQGGAFLSYFIPPGDKIPWAHLDIAGVADTEKELPYYAVGATGWGVRTLVRWAESQ